MKARYAEDNSFLCPDCDTELDCDSAGNRDRETMGGFSVEYYRCWRCKAKWEVIDSILEGKKIYPCS